MMDAVEQAAERLTDALRDAVMVALKAKGFYPSAKFEEELAELIRGYIGLRG